MKRVKHRFFALVTLDIDDLETTRAKALGQKVTCVLWFLPLLRPECLEALWSAHVPGHPVLAQAGGVTKLLVFAVTGNPPSLDFLDVRLLTAP